MAVINYKCPNCSAPLKHSIENQKWECEFCAGSFTLEELKKSPSSVSDGEMGDSGTSFHEYESDSTREKPNFSADDGMILLSCPSCGGQIAAEKSTSATFCIYCKNPAVISSSLAGERKPDYIIPFKKTKSEVLPAFINILKMKPFLPKTFRDSLKNGDINGLYVPFWLFDMDIHAELYAEGKIIKSWTDGSYRYTKTDVFNVERGAEFEVRKIPLDGCKKMDDKLMEALEPFDYSDVKDFSMEYLSGHYAQTYDIEKDTAKKSAAERVKKSSETVMRGLVKGYTSYRVKNIDVHSYNNDDSYALLPIWTLMGTYKEKLYVYAMNGQTGKIVGRLPLSVPRILLWLLGTFAVSFTAVLSIIYFLI